jgi:hypothetical protein
MANSPDNLVTISFDVGDNREGTNKDFLKVLIPFFMLLLRFSLSPVLQNLLCSGSVPLNIDSSSATAAATSISFERRKYIRMFAKPKAL